jgi:23S rRNA pseudouridine2605 synthase
MLERLQKIIGRAGIASRRHAEQLILSGQVKVNGLVITELGTKADIEHDRVEAAGKLVQPNSERRVYIVMNKPPEVVSTLADPEGRKTLRNCLRGLPERVYPVGRLDYNASGLVFLTNDGDLAAEMLKDWPNLQQSYHVKIKGKLMLGELERFGRDASATIRTVRQPDATRGHATNFWYEVTLQDSKKDILRRVLAAAQHPVEKLKRIGLGPLSLEGIPQGRYRLLIEKEVDDLRRALKIKPKPRAPYVPAQEFPEENAKAPIHARPRPANRYFENKAHTPAASRPTHRKHGPRPSRPPTMKDREGYPNQEESVRPQRKGPANWNQNRGPNRPAGPSESRPVSDQRDRRGPRRPFSGSGPTNRPANSSGNRPPNRSSGKFAGPRGDFRPSRPGNKFTGPRGDSKPSRPGNKFAGPRGDFKPSRPGNKFTGPRGDSKPGHPGNKFAGPRSGSNPGRPGNPHKSGNRNKPIRPSSNRGPR